MLESRHPQLYSHKFLYPRQLPLPPNRNSYQKPANSNSAQKPANSNPDQKPADSNPDQKPAASVIVTTPVKPSSHHSSREEKPIVCTQELSLPATPTFTRRLAFEILFFVFSHLNEWRRSVRIGFLFLSR